MIEAGLVLEGGGMRGIYTAGVLDFFMDRNLYFRNIYGVSAGACHGCSYISKQRGRAYRISTDYLKDKRYCGVYSWVTTGDFFGVKMCYDLIPNQLDVYDYITADSYEGSLYAVATDCETGEAVYLKVGGDTKDIIAVRASSSLPLLSKKVEINGRYYLDGGVSDSIPIRKSVADGNAKTVVVLTQGKDYRKEANRLLPIIRRWYKNYPAFVQAMTNRHVQYNETLDCIQSEARAGNIFVLRPSVQPDIGRIEKDLNKLRRLYDLGYQDAADQFDALNSYLMC